ncbi:MAG: hypothetical protein PHY93_07370 [Bacteriovorax sp.]|nr:hypothetical protein [Bacteriovorax sp.]
MKKILLVLATLLVSSSTIADTKMKNEITDSFTDKVKAIKEDEKEIVVQFTRHAALYKMAKTNPRYEELKTKLEKLKKEEKEVRVIAIIPMMEIKDITE